VHGDIWVTCEVDEKPVGFCYTVTEEFADSIWNMLVIGVLLSGQRQGYGGAILSFLEATLKNQSRRIRHRTLCPQSAHYIAGTAMQKRPAAGISGQQATTKSFSGTPSV
jgi:hypothetical protein